MAAKGAPIAANAPNTTQIRSAPMNLRSAMSKYAVGGEVSTSQSPFEELLSSYIENSGAPNVPPPSTIPLTVMPNEGLNEPMLDDKDFYGEVPEYYGNPDLIAQNPGFSPDPDPTYPRASPDPNPIDLGGGKSFLGSSPRNFDDPAITPELLRKIQESLNDSSRANRTQQDQLMRLIQSLKAT